MSIATLKRKTQVQYNNMSVGSKTGFSLNGTHRNQGYVGQTSLSRSLSRTLMRGGFPRGHGGCCGKFPKKPIVQSGVISIENQHAVGTQYPNVVKKSSVSNTGMLSTKYRWINRPYPYAVVKPDNNQHLNSSSDYINRLKKKTLTEIDSINNKNTNYAQRCHGVTRKCMNYNSFYKKAICTHTKPTSDYVPISSGEYIEKIHKACGVIDESTVQAKSTKMTPFACGL